MSSGLRQLSHLFRRRLSQVASFPLSNRSSLQFLPNGFKVFLRTSDNLGSDATGFLNKIELLGLDESGVALCEHDLASMREHKHH